MSGQTIRLGLVRRVAVSGEVDEILMKPGVNVIVGLKDTGKTGWLNTISFLLGDTDGAEKALGSGIAAKYDSASVQLFLGADEVILERRWKEHGAKHKIFVDGKAIQSSDFSEWMHAKLKIPALRFPRGNPYSGATWPELSWRMLFRHVYLEERFWNDLADKQPAHEQHACLLQFLGAAENLYPKELSDEVKQREELLRLRARKEQFEELLQQVTKDLISDPSISNSPTRDAIDHGIAALRSDIAEIRRQRDELLLGTIAGRERKLGDTANSEILLSARYMSLIAERERVEQDLKATERRLQELSGYKTTVSTELVRIKRVEVAGELFKPLSVRHCPQCDQKVVPEAATPGTCFVCHQNLPGELSIGWPAAKHRLAFEHEQLEGEDQELADLVRSIGTHHTEVVSRLRDVNEEITAVDVLLRPSRSAVAAILPPELSVCDMKMGQLEERAAQLLRLREAIDQRDKLARDIDELAVKVQSIASRVDTQSASIPFEQLSDAISDGINEYLNLLNEGDANRWTHKPVRLQITERSFKLMVGAVPWSSVGASSGGLLILGYHYALLKLSGGDGYHYPGLALIDFPMTLADGASIASKENYLVEPFVSLASTSPAAQVVICGRAFKALKGVNRIPLGNIWTQGGADLDVGSAGSGEASPHDAPETHDDGPSSKR
jgi:hypothetical protein